MKTETAMSGSVSYPNGQSVNYDYYGATGDERLKEIKNLTPSNEWEKRGQVQLPLQNEA